MHDRKAGDLGSRSGWLSGHHVKVGLRPVESENPTNQPHQVILQVRQLRRTLGAVAIQNNKCMQKLRIGAEVINSTEC